MLQKKKQKIGKVNKKTKQRDTNKRKTQVEKEYTKRTLKRKTENIDRTRKRGGKQHQNQGDASTDPAMKQQARSPFGTSKPEPPAGVVGFPSASEEGGREPRRVMRTPWTGI